MRRLKAAGPTHPRLVPAGETDDGPRQVPDFADGSAFTVAGTAPESRRLPFEPPPPNPEVRGRHPGRRACYAWPRWGVKRRFSAL